MKKNNKYNIRTRIRQDKQIIKDIRIRIRVNVLESTDIEEHDLILNYYIISY